MGVLTGLLYYLLASLRTRLTGTSLPVLLFWSPLYSALLGPLFSLPVSWLMGMNGRRNQRYYSAKSRFKW